MLIMEQGTDSNLCFWYKKDTGTMSSIYVTLPYLTMHELFVNPY